MSALRRIPADDHERAPVVQTEVPSIAAAGKIIYHQCDIESEHSIKTLCGWLQAEYGGLDILVSNAGFAYSGASEHVPFSKQATDTLGINFFGTLRLNTALLPLMRPNGRMVNVGSIGGMDALEQLDDSKAQRIRNPSLTVAELEAFLLEFIDAAAAGDVKLKGWPANSYGMSKLGIMAMTRIHAKDPHVLSNQITVNVCCPGWCLTDMARGITANSDTRFAKSAEQGADSCCWVALVSRDAQDAPPSGYFVRPRQKFLEHIRHARWEEWTVWSGANGGNYYLDAERDGASEQVSKL
eukprot:gnl/TRDRNA2_/TRDRNA2_87637_c0_seq1.p1 gnl/TRDRNA2_/TRDRNA2_87637_c0~~gnl/TRDRNA2_/TRDRNA2_87637_c0_seq1.p1  ORF type:complete len:323 (+),score=58.46 gnl/TRDRNA2_/TRDRNA2_87637_c0_seq1:80-970(+)